MRLRSSQFVFLLLLVCSVQSRDGYALHVVAGAVSGRTSNKSELLEVASAVVQRNSPASPRVDLPAVETRLDSASLAANSIPWPMRRPALESAGVSSFTGLLRD